MCVCKCELPLCKTSLSVIVSNIIIVSAHKMTHTKDDMHLGNSQWRVDKMS